MGSATEDNGEGGTSTAVRNTVAAGTGCGCMLAPVALVGTVIVVIVIGGFGVLLAPLIALILLFGGGGGDSDNQDVADQVVASLQGDGSGELDTSTVPDDLVEPIQDAGKLCGAIGPIVIASQIEKESGFNASLVGPNGKQGISQLPPDVFTKYGKDDDKNDKVSALDAKDSIMAQGRYLCDLANQAQKMIDGGEVVRTDTSNSVLDLALAGYHLGMDAVRAAKGVPNTNDAQGYVLAVRAQFAKYAGIAAPPDGATPGVTPGVSPGPT
ncbi:lytic transglycosylase domain-containing protein [Streptomyces olivochromogenes]|uniref:lytic transglycosylase domain-containing protein n=1 Tax=Streptomyces olivochromogenes TaxID=1963 RepID=UPI001F37F6DD|nr:lytic transglycosylase domain-containing protein [Streptomyces olivochromogenes]MCF3133414.1 lytic transglycosylase domain-containing protein [Streptomyces olivochromogenes]